MPDRLRVVIAEDNFLVREGTRHLLEDSGEVSVEAAVGTAVELLEAVQRLLPNAVITDIRMPPTHTTEGIDAAHAIRSRHPEIGVVVLSQYAAPSYAVKLFAHGTAGYAYLLKDRVGDPDTVLHALRAVTAERSVIDPEVIDGILNRAARPAESALSGLTRRELDVLAEMSRGRANPGIAKALVLSESAVEKHVSSIFAKLDLAAVPDVHRRVSAVLTFLADGTGGPPAS